MLLLCLGLVLGVGRRGRGIVVGGAAVAPVLLQVGHVELQAVGAYGGISAVAHQAGGAQGGVAVVGLGVVGLVDEVLGRGHHAVLLSGVVGLADFLVALAAVWPWSVRLEVKIFDLIG